MARTFFFLELSSHYLKAYWCAIVNFWVVRDLLAGILHVLVSNGSLAQISKVRLKGLLVTLIELATGLIVPINEINAFVSLRGRNHRNTVVWEVQSLGVC